MDQNLRHPLVSVIMPVYNCAAFVGQAIESILSQTCSDFELIIIDDCSTDNTRQIISRYTDERVVLVNKEKNTGYISSLNLAIEMSKGDFIARMDGDDISHQARLAKQVRFLNDHPEIALCGSWYQIMPSNEIVENPAENEDIKISLLDFCALGHPTVTFRKDFFTANKLTYDPQFFPAEDYELWTRISGIGKMANIPEVLLFYRSHPNQVSAIAQYDQVRNSNLCRIRMLCYPLLHPAASDVEMSRSIVTKAKIEDQLNLMAVVDWLQQLFEANMRSGFYASQKFKTYIEEKQCGIIRSFYLHGTRYKPSVLYQFYGSANRYRDCFTFGEQFKLLVKCILRWH